ncbi:MAG: hypothetical protein ACREX4_04550 [Gammaproteobacteria bacterium]
MLLYEMQLFAEQRRRAQRLIEKMLGRSANSPANQVITIQRRQPVRFSGPSVIFADRLVPPTVFVIARAQSISLINWDIKAIAPHWHGL